jgi:hypothetical protein
MPDLRSFDAVTFADAAASRCKPRVFAPLPLSK